MIKAFAIVGVVFHHIANRRFDASTLEVIRALTTIFSWSVLTFIGVSGWLHASSEERQPRRIIEFLRLRVVRLLFPYVLLVVLYALIWQLIQAFGVSGVGIKQDPSFFGKIYNTFNLFESEPVAEQLYFLPLLFSISIITHIGVRCHNVIGSGLIASISLGLGICFARESGGTGFSVGMLLFGFFSYSMGYLLYLKRNDKWRYAWVSLIAMGIVILLGCEGLSKVLSLVIIASIPSLERFSHPVFDWLGSASGIIYAYHTPFLLQPLLVFASALPSGLHLSGAILSVIVVVTLCAIFHHAIKVTPMRFVLM